MRVAHLSELTHGGCQFTCAPSMSQPLTQAGPSRPFCSLLTCSYWDRSQGFGAASTKLARNHQGQRILSPRQVVAQPQGWVKPGCSKGGFPYIIHQNPNP